MATAFAQGFGQPNIPAGFGGLTPKSNGTKGGGQSFSTSSSEKEQKSGGVAGGGGGAGAEGSLYQVHILGQIENPATYHVSISTRLMEAIGLAGDVLRKSGSKRFVELRREGKVVRYDLFKFQRLGDLSQNPFLLDNDIIFVPYSTNSVSIEGAVKSNGVYELIDDKSLWGLIELAGGYTVGVSEKEPVTIIRYEHSKKTLLKVPNVQQELKTFELLEGDVVVVPHMFNDNRRFDYNITELPADNVFYPTQNDNIFVIGGVAKPGPYNFVPTYSIRDFINQAGPTRLSKPKSAYIMTADGKTIRNLRGKKDIQLSPGDTIIVPEQKVTFNNTMAWYNTILNTFFSVFAFQQVIDKLD